MRSDNNMNKVRQHIFDTMDELKNGTMPVATAKAMSEAAQVLINSLKVELDAHRLAGTKRLPDFVSDGALLISQGAVEESTLSDSSEVTVRGQKVNIDDFISKQEPLSEDEEYLDSLLPRRPIPDVSSTGITGVTIHRMKDIR